MEMSEVVLVAGGRGGSPYGMCGGVSTFVLGWAATSSSMCCPGWCAEQGCRREVMISSRSLETLTSPPSTTLSPPVLPLTGRSPTLLRTGANIGLHCIANS